MDRAWGHPACGPRVSPWVAGGPEVATPSHKRTPRAAIPAWGSCVKVSDQKQLRV
jgi:hypothetical protein